MEKETLKKIKLLKQIKPSDNWVSSVREDVLGKKEEFNVSVLFRPTMSVAGAFVFLLTIGFFQNALAPVYNGNYSIIEEEEVMITAKEESVEKKEITLAQIEKISNDFAEMEKQYKKVQKEVLEAYVMASMIDEGSSERIDLEDREVAETLLQELERGYFDYTDTEKDLYHDAEYAFEEEDYDAVLDIFLRLR